MSGIPITEWVLDKVITVPAENLPEPAAIGYFIFAAPVIATAAVGGYAADEISHYIVHPVTEVVDAIRGAFADDDVPLFPDNLKEALDTSPSAGAVPAPASDEVPADTGARSHMPADDELPLQQEQYAPAEDELSPGYSQPAEAAERGSDVAALAAEGMDDMRTDVATELAPSQQASPGFDMESDAASRDFDMEADAAAGKYDMRSDMATDLDPSQQASPGFDMEADAAGSGGFDMEADAAGSGGFDMEADAAVAPVGGDGDGAPPDDEGGVVTPPDDTGEGNNNTDGGGAP
jgi:hypothetical protein